MPIEITKMKPLKIPSCQNCKNLAPIGNMRTNYTMQVKEERTGFFYMHLFSFPISLQIRFT